MVKKMNNAFWLAAVLGAFMFASSAFAVENVINKAAEGCKKELETYCSKVTPGEGRILACLYAHEDKISTRCDYALYDAAVQLERAVSALAYVANECDEDLDKFCSSVAVGQGRLANCLKKNEKQISKRCSKAIDDVGLEVN